MKKEMTCINCPLGCQLTVDIDDDNNIVVSGNNCIRGEIYAKNEITNPVRIVTSTITLDDNRRVSCKTNKAILKDKIFDVMNVIKNTKCKSPINIGDILISNVCDTGADVVATKNIK